MDEEGGGGGEGRVGWEGKGQKGGEVTRGGDTWQAKTMGLVEC